MVTSSRQEMTEEQLSATPTSGGVFLIQTATRGVNDTPFVD
jgi:sugar lactone lactonase YvrE